MAMSHADCTHPRTPVGRAACRKTRTSPDTPWHSRVHQPDCTGPAAHSGACVVGSNRPTKRTRSAGSGQLKRSGTRITGTPDMADVPHRFGTLIRYALDHDLDVRVGPEFTEDQRSIVVESSHGWLTLTWRSANPNGVHAVSWRPRGTSVAVKVRTVNEGVLRLTDGDK